MNAKEIKLKETRQRQNREYYASIKTRGLQTSSFLMPIAIRRDVKKFIEMKTIEYNLKHNKETV